jgi:hypothetical protein
MESHHLVWSAYDLKDLDFVGTTETFKKPIYKSRAISCLMNDSADACKKNIVAQAETVWRALAHISRTYDLTGVQFTFYAFSDTLNVVYDPIILDGEYANTLYQMAQMHPFNHKPEFRTETKLVLALSVLLFFSEINTSLDIIITINGCSDEALAAAASIKKTNRTSIRGMIIGFENMLCDHHRAIRISTAAADDTMFRCSFLDCDFFDWIAFAQSFDRSKYLYASFFSKSGVRDVEEEDALFFALDTYLQN